MDMEESDRAHVATLNATAVELTSTRETLRKEAAELMQLLTMTRVAGACERGGGRGGEGTREGERGEQGWVEVE